MIQKETLDLIESFTGKKKQINRRVWINYLIFFISGFSWGSLLIEKIGNKYIIGDTNVVSVAPGVIAVTIFISVLVYRKIKKLKGV